MSMYLSNSEVGPTGAEPVEYLDDPGVLGGAFDSEVPSQLRDSGPEQSADEDRSWFEQRGPL